MRLTKHLLGTATAILLVALAGSAVANASSSATLTQSRVAASTNGARVLQHRINVLLPHVSRPNERAAMRGQVMRISERVIKLNRRVVGMNRVARSMTSADEATWKALLALDQRLIRVDRATLRLDQTARLGHGSHLRQRVTTLTHRLSGLNVSLRRWLHSQPSPPAPDPTPTPTPSASPTPTPSATPPAPGTTTISNQTLTTYLVPAGTHDVVYDTCTFTGGDPNGDTGGVLTISRPCYNLTFRNCTIDSGPSNGIKIVDGGGTIHDITFDRCHILAQPRMGFECIISSNSTTAAYQNVRLLNCVIEPAQEEAVSFSTQNRESLPVNCLIDGCTLMGAGNMANPRWGYSFEINGATNVTMRNTTIYAARGGALNLNCYTGSANCGWTFANDTLDFSRLYQTFGTDTSQARLMLITGMNGAVWTDCTHDTGNAANHVWNAGGWNNCSNNDLSTCTVTGTCAPYQSYWTAEASNVNNKMPVVASH